MVEKAGRSAAATPQFWILLLLIAIGALVFRLPQLSKRPMHADEAVQAAKVRNLWTEGQYAYDPDEYHGPSLAYATLTALWVQRPDNFAATTAASYRIIPALFGAGLILLPALLVDALGRKAVLWAGLLTAVSPALVFYNRYFIHESLLVFFTLAMIGCGWRYFCSARLAWCLAAGACAGLMQSTKETSALAFAAMLGALVAVAALHAATRRREPVPTTRPPLRGWHIALGVLAAVVVTVILLSSFMTNLRGPLDGIVTYLPWLKRAGGHSPHIHGWTFYLRILGFWRLDDGPWWSEGLILMLAAVASLLALFPFARRLWPLAHVPFVRWTVCYTLLLTTTYCIIPYKTPWCLMGFLHGMILLAGLGATALLQLARWWPLQLPVAALLLAATGQLAWQSHRASFVLDADPQNPYVYAHTATDIDRLANDLEELAQASPQRQDVLVQVVWHDAYYWPLPWYLRSFRRVGYWTEVPVNAGAPLVLSSPLHDEALTERLDETHLMTGYYSVRPNVLAMLWVRMDLWEAHLRRLGRI